jgi:hypothetical protein
MLKFNMLLLNHIGENARVLPKHFPRFVPNTYIEFYVKSMHCYCLYTAIISDIIGLNTVFLEIIYL